MIKQTNWPQSSGEIKSNENVNDKVGKFDLSVFRSLGEKCANE